VLTKDPSDPSGLRFSEVTIFRSAALFEQHSNASFVADVQAPALEQYIQEGVSVTAIGLANGDGAVEETMTVSGAIRSDVRGGYKNL